jgi:hypothetical protein
LQRVWEYRTFSYYVFPLESSVFADTRHKIRVRCIRRFKIVGYAGIPGAVSTGLIPSSKEVMRGHEKHRLFFGRTVDVYGLSIAGIGAVSAS